MAIVFTPHGTAVAASGASPQIVTMGAINAGDYLVALMAYDNSGGGGADPVSGQISITGGTWLNASVSAQTGHNDPGSASAGLAVRCVAWPCNTNLGGGTIGVAWSGTVAVRSVVLMRVSSDSGGIIGYRANSGATGANGVNVTTKQQTLAHNNTEGVLMWAGYEYGAAIVGDADTFVGTWSAVYGAFTGTTTSGMAAYFQSKVTTANATQTWDPTAAVASDWITGGLVFTETPVAAVTQAAYRFYDDAGTESGAAALAAQDTPVAGNLSNGDGYGAVRIRLQSTNAVAVDGSTDFQLEFEKNASGTWIDVGESYGAGYSWQNWNVATVIGGSTSSKVSIAQSFQGNGLRLSRVGFYMKRIGSPNGNLTAVLYAHTGTFGTTGTPTGAALATSTARPSSDARPDFHDHLYFDFDKTFTLVNGTNYCIAIVTDQTLDNANNVEVAWDTSTPTHVGSSATRATSGGAWTSGTPDLIFSVYTYEPTGAVIPYDNPNLTNGAAIGAARLTGGTGSFNGGVVSETGRVTNGFNATSHVELLFSVKLLAAQLANGDTIRFRVLKDGLTTGMTYAVTPTINIVTAETNRQVVAASTVTSTDRANYKESPQKQDGYLSPTVGIAHTPDPAVMPDTGCVWVFKVRGPQAISNPWNICSQNPTDGNVSWRLNRHGNDGSLAGAAYPAGTYASGLFFASTSAVTKDLVNPECLSLAYTRTSQAYELKRSTDDGVTFPTMVTNGFGTSFAGWFNSTGRMVIGGDSDGASSVWDDRIYWVELRTGTDPLGGTVLWRFDANEYVSGTSWVDARGRTWTIATAAAITPRVSAMGVGAAATITSTDVQTTPAHYTETDRPVVIVSTVTTTALLHLNEQVHTNYLIPFVGHVTTPDSGPLPASCVWVMKLRPHHIMSSDQTFGGQWDAGTISWSLYMQNGNFFAALSLDGVAQHMNSYVGAVTTTTVPNGADVFLAMRIQADYDGANGRITTFRSTDGTNWTQIGVGSPTKWTVLHDSTGPIRAGTRRIGYPSWNGRMYSSEMRTGIDPNAGTVLWRFDSNEYAGAGTSFVDPRGQTWTLTTAGAIYAPPPTAAATATVTSTDVHTIPVKHIETDLPVTVVSTVATPTDRWNNKELVRPVAVVATTMTTDQVDFKQLDRPVAVVSTVSAAVDQADFKELHGVAAPGYATFPGGSGLNSLTTPEYAGLHNAEDFTVVARVRPTTSWVNAAPVTIGCRAAAANQWSWTFRVLNTGALSHTYSINGTSLPGVNSTVTLPAAGLPVDWLWVAVTFDGNNGASGKTSRFWTSPNGTAWTQLGADVTSATAVTLFNSNAGLMIGQFSNVSPQGWIGDIQHFSVRSGWGAGGTVGGTETFRIDGTELTDPNAASFIAATGQLVTINRAAVDPKTIITIAVVAGNPAISVVSAVTSTDVPGVGTQHYDETGRSVAIVSAATATDQVDHKELDRPVAVVAATTPTALLKLGERDRPVAIVSAVTTTDVLKRGERDRPVTIVATITPTDLRHVGERDRPVAVISTINRTDVIKFGELLRSVAVVSTTATTDRGRYKELGATATSQSVLFPDGTSYYMRPGLDGEPLTMACWMYLDRPTGGYSVAVGLDNPGGEYVQFGGHINFYFGSNEEEFFGPVLDVGAWYYAAAVVDPVGQDYSYLALAAQSSLTAFATTAAISGVSTGSNLGIGIDRWADSWDGRVAQVKIWNAALTKAELEAEKPLDSVARTANLWAYYSFRNGPQTNDESGNGRTLTIGETTPITATGPLSVVDGLPILIVSTVTSTDTAVAGSINYNETGRLLLTSSAVSSTDQADYDMLGLGVAVISTITNAVDQTDYDMLGLSNAVVSTITTSDQADWKHVSTHAVTSAFAVVEQYGYGALALPVVVASAVTAPTDQADYDQLTLPVVVASAVTTTDLLKRGERLLPVTVVSATTTTDQADFEDPPRSVAITSVVTVGDNQMSPGHFDETNRPVSLLLTTTLWVDQTDYDQLALAVVGASTVALPVDQTDYDQLALPVAAAATTAVTDTIKRGERDRPVTIVATASSTDVVHWRGPALSVTASSTVASTDLLKRGELARGVVVVSTVTPTDSWRRRDLALPVVAAATVATTDQADFKQLALPVVITSAVTSLDIVIGGPVHYNETGKQINIVSAVATTDRADFNQTLTVSVVAATSCTDQRKHGERNTPVTVASQVASTDQADLHDLVSVSIISATTLTPTVVMRDLIKPIDIDATVTSTERSDLSEVVLFNLATLFGSVDTADYSQMLDLLLVSQVILNDVMHGQIGVLTDAIAIYLGDQPVSRVYVGDVQVWEEN